MESIQNRAGDEKQVNMMENEAMSLYELNSLVRRGLHSILPDEYWIQAELSDVRSNYSGHCYLEFVQKDPKSNALIAKARGVIWSSVFMRLRPYFERETGQAFVSGIKVMVKVTVDFHELYGFSLTVVDIDPAYTIGDMARRRKEILKRLDEEGILTMNKELEMPEPLQRIAVISSATAAGYGDFCNQLHSNKFGFVFYTKLFPAIMQGDRVEETIISSLERIYSEIDNWDVVVIIRGGGATSDLSGFDTYDLAAHCAQFPLPIITGIGHERDDTVIDMVSHTRVKTPTAAAEYIIGMMLQTASRLDDLSERLRSEIPVILNSESERLNRLVARIPLVVQSRLQRENMRCERMYSRLVMSWQKRFLVEQHRLDVYPRLLMYVRSVMEKETHKIDLMERILKSASPEQLLKRGYSITLLNGKSVRDVSKIKSGDEVETVLATGKFKSIVK